MAIFLFFVTSAHGYVYDDFEDNTIDITLWNWTKTGSNAHVIESNGYLMLNVTAVGGNNYRVRAFTPITSNKTHVYYNITMASATSACLFVVFNDSMAYLTLFTGDSLGTFKYAYLYNASDDYYYIYENDVYKTKFLGNTTFPYVGWAADGGSGSCVMLIETYTDVNYTMMIQDDVRNILLQNFSYDISGTAGSSDTFYGVTDTWINESIYHNITISQFNTNMLNRTFNLTLNQQYLLNMSPNNHSVLIDNCSSYNYPVMNFSVYIENYPDVSLPVNVEILVNVSNAYNETAIYSDAYTGVSNFSLCVPYYTTDWITVYILYTSPNGFTHRWYIVNQTAYYNQTLEYSLYNYNTTTAISDLRMTIRNSLNYNHLADIVVQMQRQYVSEAVWRTVQMDTSGNFGDGFFNIEEEDTDYKFIFKDQSNNLLYTSAPMKFTCDGGVCDITFNINPTVTTSTSNIDIDLTHTYNNTTGLSTIVWSEVNGVNTNLWAVWTQERFDRSLTICNNTQSGTGGTLSCNVSSYPGGIALSIRTYNSPPIYQFLETFEVLQQKIKDLISSGEGNFWMFIIILIAFTMGLANPLASIGFTIFSMLIGMFFGLTSFINVTMLIIIGGLGIIIGENIKQKGHG